ADQQQRQRGEQFEEHRSLGDIGTIRPDEQQDHEHSERCRDREVRTNSGEVDGEPHERGLVRPGRDPDDHAATTAPSATSACTSTCAESGRYTNRNETAGLITPFSSNAASRTTLAHAANAMATVMTGRHNCASRVARAARITVGASHAATRV